MRCNKRKDYVLDALCPSFSESEHTFGLHGKALCTTAFNGTSGETCVGKVGEEFLNTDRVFSLLA